MTAARSPGERGQGLVEFALIMPIFLLALLGMLEFGLAFNHHLTIEYATREASRTGSSLARGGSANCAAGVDVYMIDAQIIGAAQRILKSPGSPVQLSNVAEIRLFKSDGSGGQVGTTANSWVYTPGLGPDLDPGVGVDRLDFSPTSTGWPVCSRNSGPNPDSIGVRIRYTYRFATPLGTLINSIGGSSLARLDLDDRTIMALNPQ